MGKSTDAADAIRRAAKQYEHFIVAADLLDKLGSLENAIAEAKTQVDVITQEREAAQAEYTNLQHALTKKKAELKQASEAAQAKADKIIDDADAARLTIIADANEQAKQIVEGALISKSSELGALQSKVSAVQDALATALADERAATNRAAEANAAADDAEKRLAKVKATLASLNGVL